MTKDKNRIEQNEFVAPDGGWGWMIVLGFGISSMCLISVLQTFGLMYKDRFEELQFSVTDTTSLMSINSSFGMILGILNGPLLKRFGYRKLALVGGVLFVTGFFHLAFAETYLQCLISYGMVASIGTAMTFSSFSLALNTYFKMRRSLASSFSITITGMGPILLPLLITHLLSNYGWKWSALIIAALTMNHFVGALLLQPVKWHLKPQIVEEGSSPNKDTPSEKSRQQSNLDTYGATLMQSAEILGRSYPELSLGLSQTSLYKKSFYQEISTRSLDKSRSKIGRKLKSLSSLDNEVYGDMMKSTLYVLEGSGAKDKPIKCASDETLDHRSFADSPYESQKLLSRAAGGGDSTAQDVGISKTEVGISVENDDSVGKKIGIGRKIFEYIKRMYDLDLFLDPIYINLLIGLATATVGEIMFSLLTPFILSELGLDLNKTAMFMSITAITDVVFRLVAPFVGHITNFDSRIMYLLAIFVLLITRAALFLCESFNSFIVIAVFLGLGKGFRTVYWILVVPDYVPLNKLASAGAFQSLVNGISLLISGPLIGAIIAKNGNQYVNAVFAANFLTLITIVLWGMEFIIIYYRNKKMKIAAT